MFVLAFLSITYKSKLWKHWYSCLLWSCICFYYYIVLCTVFCFFWDRWVSNKVYYYFNHFNTV